MVLDYGRGPQQVLEIYGRMGRARAQQVLKYGSWSLPIFVGRSFFDSSKQFRGDFKPFSSEFGRFWAILGGFERFCAGSECFPAAKGVRSRGGSRYGSASPASIGIVLEMVCPSKYWKNIWNLYPGPYGRPTCFCDAHAPLTHLAASALAERLSCLLWPCKQRRVSTLL